MRVLVTGHMGFIGSNFYNRLKERGEQVIGIDIRGEHPIDANDFFRSSEMHFDLVIHAAAHIGNRDERDSSPMPVAANLALDSNYFQWALRTRPTQVVYFSSSAAYPTWLQHYPYRLVEDDIDLEDIRQPDGMYGLAKLVGEVQAREARKQGLDVLVVRPQSGYGSDQSVDYPFPSIVRRAMYRADPFEIWGNGSQVRDFIHVVDIMNAVFALLDSDERGPINLGSGIPTSMTELAVACAADVGYDPTFAYQLDKPMGTMFRCAEVSKLHQHYIPKISLAEGIHRAVSDLEDRW